MNNSDIKIYQSKDGQTEVQVKFENETVWLSQKQMAQLFDKDTDTVGLHLKNIYTSGELDEISTTEESSVVQLEGKRNRGGDEHLFHRAFGLLSSCLTFQDIKAERFPRLRFVKLSGGSCVCLFDIAFS